MRDAEKNPLQTLVADVSDWREQLAELLLPFVQLSPDGHIEFRGGYEEEPARRRVLLAVLALSAAKDLGSQRGPITPRLVENVTGMAGGTIRRCLRELVRARDLVEVEGDYDMNRARLRSIREEVLDGH